MRDALAEFGGVKGTGNWMREHRPGQGSVAPRLAMARAIALCAWQSGHVRGEKSVQDFPRQASDEARKAASFRGAFRVVSRGF